MAQSDQAMFQSWRGETVSNDSSLLNMEKVSLGSNVDEISKRSLLDAQKQNNMIGKWLKSWRIEGELLATKVSLRQRRKLYRDEDVLLSRRSGPYSQLVLPQKFHTIVFKELHQEMGHLGALCVLQLARERFYRPNVTWKMTKVCPCLKQRRPSLYTRAPLHSVTTSRLFELVSIDFLHLEASSGGNEYISVVIKHFARFAQSYVTKYKLGKAAAYYLLNDFVLRFGFPINILHYQGRGSRINFLTDWKSLLA